MVDDEIGPRESLRMILHPLYQVYTAANGEEALAFLQKHDFDLVTLDMKMPGASGLEILREIRKRKVDVDVVIISGYLNSNNKEEVKQNGAVGVITKPFNVTDVIACVGKAVENKKYHRKMESLVQAARNLGLTNSKKNEPSLFS